MHADPLFVDLRIALGNAEPIRNILVDHLATGADPTAAASPSQRALLDAGLAQMIQSIYLAAENLLLNIAASNDGGAPAKDENWHAALLARMAHEFPGRRPAVLSNPSLDILNELRYCPRTTLVIAPRASSAVAVLASVDGAIASANPSEQAIWRRVAAVNR